jgi:hypothetical protein
VAVAQKSVDRPAETVIHILLHEDCEDGVCALSCSCFGRRLDAGVVAKVVDAAAAALPTAVSRDIAIDPVPVLCVNYVFDAAGGGVGVAGVDDALVENALVADAVAAQYSLMCVWGQRRYYYYDELIEIEIEIDVDTVHALQRKSLDWAVAVEIDMIDGFVFVFVMELRVVASDNHPDQGGTGACALQAVAVDGSDGSCCYSAVCTHLAFL